MCYRTSNPHLLQWVIRRRTAVYPAIWSSVAVTHGDTTRTPGDVAVGRNKCSIRGGRHESDVIDSVDMRREYTVDCATKLRERSPFR